MNQIMIDIETLGTTPDSVILSIGAVKFSFDDDDIETFKQNIDPRSCKKYGLVTQKDTIQFWADQPIEVQKSVMSNQSDIEYALAGLNNFIGGYNSKNRIWANGVAFDISMLEWSYRVVGIPCPWRYFQIMDVRTIISLSGIDWKNYPRIGDHHDSIGDCLTQIKIIKEILSG
jgi:exodeoxyribonuclease VIII